MSLPKKLVYPRIPFSVLLAYSHLQVSLPVVFCAPFTFFPLFLHFLKHYVCLGASTRAHPYRKKTAIGSMSNQRTHHNIHSNYSLRFQESCTPEFPPLHQVGLCVKSNFNECVIASLSLSYWMLSLFVPHRTPCLTCMNSRRFWKMQQFLAMVCRYSPSSLH